MTCQDSFHEVAFNISFWTRNISSARILFWRGVWHGRCFSLLSPEFDVSPAFSHVIDHRRRLYGGGQTSKARHNVYNYKDDSRPSQLHSKIFQLLTFFKLFPPKLKCAVEKHLENNDGKMTNKNFALTLITFVAFILLDKK